MKKIKKYRGLIVSLILAIVTVLAIHQYILAIEKQNQTEGPSVEHEDVVEIVVARRDLTSGTVLTVDDLETKSVHKEEIHPDAITDKEEVLGEAVIQDMVREEVLLAQKILPEEEVNRLSHAIPEGKRAISVSVDEVSGVAGFIQAGDMLDVVATDFEEQEEGQEDTETRTILQDLKVLAAGDRVLYQDQELVQEVSTVTLAVSPSEAESLTDAEENGVIRLLLNPLVEED
ncbi:Flp pilus assembly protein CpaB [Natranaerofaba carboxydovora]|uniref:Flp pilus assembly protein CpaB n=1 Tax=Natranaerofaba carboxydovora TaxID=2742683 RepID=UPI001F12BC34|nr:Flp pilus assembly protein CpaB [Natranaerofaba carboxydovora]UMZ75034.1 Flp pilus assembly protein RcpC/CpaB [Natranaerofaba carboxydovora]